MKTYRPFTAFGGLGGWEAALSVSQLLKELAHGQVPPTVVKVVNAWVKRSTRPYNHD